MDVPCLRLDLAGKSQILDNKQETPIPYTYDGHKRVSGENFEHGDPGGITSECDVAFDRTLAPLPAQWEKPQPNGIGRDGT